MKKLLMSISALILLGTGSLAHAGAVISNGIISLGVRDLGSLIFPEVGASAGGVGICRGTPGAGCPASLSEAAAIAYLGEGWGVADAGSGTSGYASLGAGDFNVSLVSFSSSGTGAVAVADVGTTFRVTHRYTPSLSGDLYRIRTEITNISGAAVTDLRYRRNVDWDVPPTTFDENVTGVGSVDPDVLAWSDNGFGSPDPLTGIGPDLAGCGISVDFFDCPGTGTDHGWAVDLAFGGLGAGETLEFLQYYGVAATEAAADLARSITGISAYSYGQCNDVVPGACPDSTVSLTWIWGYGGRVPEPMSLLLLGTGLLGVAGFSRRRRKS